jgi:replication-associated recombination protein RarA
MQDDDFAIHDENPGQDITETHIWGPPGCGKTTYVSRQVAKAAEKYGGDAVLVSSFTKAAATELAMRNLPIPQD